MPFSRPWLAEAICIRSAHKAVKGKLHCFNNALNMCRKIGEFLLCNVCAINAIKIANADSNVLARIKYQFDDAASYMQRSKSV